RRAAPRLGRGGGCLAPLPLRALPTSWSRSLRVRGGSSITFEAAAKTWYNSLPPPSRKREFDMTRRTLHIIAQAHLDPVWLWPWRDGAAQTLTTLQSALDCMDELPDLRFSHSSAAAYRWVQEMDPRMFAQIRQRVREGRWEAVGGWVVEPDCNLPATESFVRQALYGKRWFAEQLGADVRIAYNVDSFGHSGGLPQLLARAGYSHYVMMRPQAQEMELPHLFWWESADG